MVPKVRSSWRMTYIGELSPGQRRSPDDRQAMMQAAGGQFTELLTQHWKNNSTPPKLREQLAARNPGPPSTSDGDSGEGGGELRGDGDGDDEDTGVRSDSEEEEQEDPLGTGHSGELPYST